MSLSKYKNKHAGERVFIAGNGPSLEDTPLSLLENEYTITMNSIDELFDATSWRPTYYLQVNGGFPESRIERISRINSEGITSFINEVAENKLEGRLEHDEVCEYVSVELKSGPKPRDYFTDAENKNYESFWSSDITKKVYVWTTSLYAATQVASYMGFDEIYFIGCDLYLEFKPLPYTVFNSGTDPIPYIRKPNNVENFLDFIFQEGRPIRSLVNGIWFRAVHRPPVINILYKLYNYFDRVPKTHFEDGDPETDRIYQAGKNRALMNIHKMIRIMGTHEGFECYNATKGGQLEVHQRVDLTDIV